MTTVNNSKKFFVSGLLNASGETFSYKREYSSIIEGGKRGKAFYEGLGFKNIAVKSCHGIVLIKDSNDRLLSFITPIDCTKADGSIEYRTAFWALKEVERQAEAVAKKAAAAKASAKVDAKDEKGREVATKEKSAIIKGSIEVEQPRKKIVYYAVRKGREVGIFTDWAKASALVTGYPDARFKKFSVLKDAEEFMKGGDNE